MIHLVIPAYNEADNAALMAASLKGAAPSLGEAVGVHWVDDGSRDGSAGLFVRAAEGLDVRVITHEVNQGVAQAFRSGFDAALKIAKPEDMIVTLEADNTGDLGVLTEMIRNFRQGADIVLASCYAPGGEVVGTNLFRIILSRSANLLIQSLFPMKGVHTYSSFYRIYRAEALADVRNGYGDYFEERGFVCVVELLIRFFLMHKTIREVPMTLRTARRVGQSKMKIINTIRGYLKVISKYVFRRFRKI
ncbi:MAG: glycosyltransferase [Candidatus Omnitrophica bacterium]|nr:glycosyltransferase [Candidatus Omnitrophota bacterium]